MDLLYPINSLIVTECNYGPDCPYLCGNCNADSLIVTECNYGPDCPNPCGNCNAGSACDRVDGTCLNGCADGFEGAQCLTGLLFIVVKQTNKPFII